MANPHRKRLHREQDGLCHYCKRRTFIYAVEVGDQGRLITVDHRQPISRGGSLGRDNIVGACKACNEAKGAFTEEEFMQILAAAASLEEAHAIATVRSRSDQALAKPFARVPMPARISPRSAGPDTRLIVYDGYDASAGRVTLGDILGPLLRG